MKFPLWQYLRQLFGETHYVVNPAKYQQIYSVEHLKDCYDNSFLEHCWNSDYNRFIKQYEHLIDRRYREEGTRGYRDLCEYCWQLDYYRWRRYRSSHYLSENLSNSANHQ